MRVKVSFVFRDEQSAEGALEVLPALGAQVTAHYRRLMDAWVPIAALGKLGDLPGLMIAHKPFPVFPASLDTTVHAAAGAVLSEGVAASGAIAWQFAEVDGAGVKVGIIDSFGGYNGVMEAGEVPAATTVGTLDVGSVHGTACAEVIHDMAPGAELLLASAGTTTEAAGAIAALAAAGARVISSSVEYVTPDAPSYSGPGREPGDGTGALCDAIAEARTGAGALFVQAAGNYALSHWDGQFVDTNRNNYHEFAPGVEVDAIAPETSLIATFLRWDDWPASSQDYDLELWVKNGENWEFVVASTNPQTGTQPPWEYIERALDPLKQYGIRIKMYRSTRNVFLDLTDLTHAKFDLAVPARSLADVAACPSALSVAALDTQAAEFPVEASSSQGPTRGPGGTAEGGGDQPRIAAYAGVDTVSYGENAFDGTSAATPHVAGAAALVLQQQPLFSPDQVQTFLEARAIDLETPGYDHVTGAGRLALGQAGPCSFELAPSQAEETFGGGDGSFSVSTTPGCPWEAVSSDTWLAVTELSGTGSGDVSYTVEANHGAARSATITVGDAVFTVNQEAAPCAYELSAPGTSVTEAGGEGTVDVTTNRTSCEWTAVANEPWITVSGGAGGTGSATVSFTVAANEGEARSGTITIAGLTFTVEQAAVPCTFALGAPGAAMPVAGGQGSVGVTTNLASCEWAAVSNEPWITVIAGASGSGNGEVAFTVSTNDGEARTGTITIGGRTFTVEQAAVPCTYDLSALGVAMPAGGGEGSVGVIANLASCGWTSVASMPWIQVTGGATGAGNGTVTFTVAANTGEARDGTLTIAGRTFTIEQAAAPCAYELSAPGASLAAVGGPGSVEVTSNRASCAWTAVSNAAWITVTGGAAGSGSGTVTFTLAANTGAARSGTITIAGHTFTVEQAAVPCAYELGALSAPFVASGGSGSVGVTANIGTCGWTALSHAAWVTITGGAAATGSGTVTFTVAANAGAARTATLTVAEKTFTVLQGAAGCTYSLYSWSSPFYAEGGPGQTRVWTNLPSCTWNSISNAPSWLTITAGQSGTGSEMVSYEVAANPGLARQGTLTVAGRIYTVYQEGAPCSFSLSASGTEVVAAGGAGSVDVITSSAACAWTAVSSAPDWLAVTAGASGAGNGTVAFAVGANAGDIRTATLTIGGQTFTVHQASPPCAYEITPDEASFAAAGGVGSVTVSTSFASCAWAAASNAPSWLTITAGATGAGAGVVEYSVADNPGEPRAGSLTIAGRELTVSQDKHGIQIHRNVKRRP